MTFDGYVFVDIETTGLDPVQHSILEVGILVTDCELVAIDAFQEQRYFITANHSNIDDFVLKMHTGNGLWKDCRFSPLTLTDLENRAIEFLKDTTYTEADWSGQPMTGSSVHFDRSFINQQMPHLDEVFHYRNFDVSTLKQFYTRYNLPFNRQPSKKLHRALSDCYDTRDELQAYLEGINVIRGEAT